MQMGLSYFEYISISCEYCQPEFILCYKQSHSFYTSMAGYYLKFISEFGVNTKQIPFRSLTLKDINLVNKC